MKNTTKAPIHYRDNGQLHCPVVGHVVTELKINQKDGKFAGLTVVESSATSEMPALTSDQHSIFSQDPPPLQVSPNSKTRVFLEEFNMLISRIMKANDLSLNNNLLQSFSDFQWVYEGLKDRKSDNNKDGIESMEISDNELREPREIEIIEISDDHDELREPREIEIIEISDDEDEIQNPREIELIEISDDDEYDKPAPRCFNLMNTSIRNLMSFPGVEIERYPLLPKFKNLRLKKAALTHRKMNSIVGFNYERLEHLGDRVLQHVANQMAFDRTKNHPMLCDHEQKIMKRIEVAINFFVNNKTLAVIGNILDIATYVIKEVGGPQKLSTKDTADYVEALIGALYEDNNRNFDPIREWYEPITGSLLDRILYATIYRNPNEADVFNWVTDIYSHLNKKFKNK
ncbi:4475_t:CDS:2 [Ambispora leptoticha]|uniref:4475_t:CDS:1 n=1 Tax=Ambispora leptoticha TaxID=144679 RepID=A0A9N9DJE6_9GLOM|nr:4475_t:CDS:2 [Ambispora leptoticha]